MMGKSNRNQTSQEAPKTELRQLEEGQMLNGSSVQPGIVKVAGFEVQLGQVVTAAWGKTGLTVEEWNALEDAPREAFIAAEIDVLEEGGEGALKEDAINPVAGAGEGEGTNPASGDDLKDGPAEEQATDLTPPVDTPISGDGGSEIDPDATIDPPELETEAAPQSKTDGVGAWARGVLEDYASVMGEGQTPTEAQGAKAQASLLHMFKKLNEIEDLGSTSAFADVSKFFRENRAYLTSDANLGRFISEPAATNLRGFASAA